MVTISDINDNPPKFVGTPYQVTVPEVTNIDCNNNNINNNKRGNLIKREMVTISFCMIFQSTPVGSVIFDKLFAIDPDSNVNGQIEYRILDEDGGDEDGGLEYDEYGNVEAPYFSIDLPHQGLITVARQLDYEKQKMHVLRIIASVRKYFILFFCNFTSKY